MKKYLPIILLLLGVLVLIVAFFLVKGGKKEGTEQGEVEEDVPEIVLAQRPVTSLTPTSDGHWLKLKVEKIVIDAETLDYELLYILPDGRTQGVPGTVKLDGQKQVERDLLLGSESSGKFRYDEGVKQGTLTLRLRDEKGKLVAKFSTDFSLLNEEDILKTTDGNFEFKLDKKAKNAFFVMMETFGFPDELTRTDITYGPYGLFSSPDINAKGKIILQSMVVYWNGQEWLDYKDESLVNTGSIIVVGYR